MASDKAAALIASLGHATGLPDLKLDAEGRCLLRFDTTEAMIEFEPGEERLVLHADVGAVPAHGREALFARLLEANLLWKDTAGATLALHPASGRVLLMQAVSVEAAPARFPDLVERFVNAAEAWAERIGASPAVAAAPPHERLLDATRYA